MRSIGELTRGVVEQARVTRRLRKGRSAEAFALSGEIQRGKFSVMRARCFIISNGGIYRIGENTKVFGQAIPSDLGDELAILATMDAVIAGLILRREPASISAILGLGGETEVVDPVVDSVMVYVVDNRTWPLSEVEEPRSEVP